MNEKQHTNPLPKDLVQDIQAYLDGQIEQEKFERLESLLSESEEARRFYRSYTNMDANLREISEEHEGLDIAPSPSRRNLGLSLMQAAATFALGAGLVFIVLGRSNGKSKVVDSPAVGSNNENPPVYHHGVIEGSLAILTEAVGVVWEDGATNYPVESVLPADTLKLAKGLLQIEFFSGATVIVEGPAEFELVDPMRAICHHGKTRANVPEFAKGFTIASKTMDVVDLGTEFALVVEKDGTGEVHVFDGEVEIHEKPGGKMHSVMMGNGVRFGDGDPEFMGLNEMGFVDAQRVSFLANAEADQHLNRWLEYSEELKAHPDVLLYYSFDEKTTWSRKLRNVRKMTADPLHGAIVGCNWSEGRWRGKGSLEFKRTGDRVRIQIPGTHKEFTLMAWVRIDGFDRELNSLMLSDNWVPGGVHWQFTRSGELVLGTKNEKSAGHYQSEPVLNQSHLGRWIQLAVSYDSERKEVAHYVNGRQVWRGEMKVHIPVTVPRGELGNWKNDYDSTGVNLRNLNGRMDEFVVFSRGMNGAEILDIYDRGKPHS